MKELDNELKKILWACYEYWQKTPQCPEGKVVRYKWINRIYKEKFGEEFNQLKLKKLIKLGFLQKDDTYSEDRKPYYKIINSAELENLLKEWNLG
jgi:hypothetical protein